MPLSNDTYEGEYVNVIQDGGNPTTGTGVVAIKGTGNIDFSTQARAIDRREQGAFVYKDCESGSVILEFGADDLNTLLRTNATFDSQNDRWNADVGSTVVVDNAAENDINIKLAFTELQTYYVDNNLSGAASEYTSVKDNGLTTYFSDFVDEVKKSVIVDGGEVMFTDETLVGKPYTSEDLASTIRYATGAYTDLSSNNPAVDVLGSGGDITSGSGDTGILTGLTNVKNNADTLEILEINAMLRKMMDIGYSGRDASGSGDISGSGVNGLIDQNPFIAGDVFFFEDGFSINASVEIEDELHQTPQQLLNANGGTLTLSNTTLTYEKTKHESNLFIVLA